MTSLKSCDSTDNNFRILKYDFVDNERLEIVSGGNFVWRGLSESRLMAFIESNKNLIKFDSGLYKLTLLEVEIILLDNKVIGSNQIKSICLKSNIQNLPCQVIIGMSKKQFFQLLCNEGQEEKLEIRNIREVQFFDPMEEYVKITVSFKDDSVNTILFEYV